MGSLRQYKHDWYMQNRDRINTERNRRYSEDAAFSADIKAKANKRYSEKRGELLEKSLAYARANKPKMRAWRSEWKKRNSHKVAADRALRRSTQRHATPPWLDKKTVEPFYDEARRLTQQTGILHHVDHRYPIVHERLTGLHVPWNLCVVPASVNWSKNNRIPEAAFRGQ